MKLFGVPIPGIRKDIEQKPKTPQDEILISRRAFVGGSFGLIAGAMLPTVDVLADEIGSDQRLKLERKGKNLTEQEIKENKIQNIKSITAIELALNSKWKTFKMSNPLANSKINIYNSASELVEDYNEGKFHAYKGKYYVPESFGNRAVFDRLSKVDKDKYEEVEAGADYVIVAEIQGTNESEGFDKKGFAVIKNGTAIRRIKINNRWENYIAECNNRIYAIAKLCPPCN